MKYAPFAASRRTHPLFRAAVALLLIVSMSMSQVVWAQGPPEEAQPNEAAEPPTAPKADWLAEPPEPVGWTGKDWAFAYLSGLGATALGGLGFGFSVLLLSTDDGDDDDDDDDDDNSLGAVGLAFISLGLMIGGPSIGVDFYGQSAGHDGNIWGAVGGQVAGMIFVGGLASLMDLGKNGRGAEPGEVAALVSSAVIIIPLTTALGYRLTVDDSAPAQPSSGALLDISEGRGASLGVPAVQISPLPNEFRVDVPLVGGTF